MIKTLTHPPTVKQGMLIRRPPEEVFQAFVDPTITQKFWFTKSSGKLTAGAKVRWDWEMYGAFAEVTVQDFEDNRRIVFLWRGNQTVEFRFVPWQSDTYVLITVGGFSGGGDEQVATALDSMGGFSFLLASAKAMLEHNIVLTTALDHHPNGLQV